MLTRADFDNAVNDALRHDMRADLLRGSPLLETPIAGGMRLDPRRSHTCSERWWRHPRQYL